ncbi:MAG: lyase family protein, partial [Pseudomonadota bacterium]|nr:lyase family protein [Pseudomonadota bacterium]
MIPRYSRPDMVSVWEPANKFRIWYLIEAHATQAQADLGTVPQRAAEAVWKVRERMEARDIDVAAIDEIEAEVKHDVIAFLTWLAGLVGDDSRFVHQGMTSSDVLDTTLAVQLKEAGALLLAGSERLLAALKTRAHELKDVPTIGRSHAIHAEPTTFGLKLAGHYALIHRCHDRLAQAIDEVSTCAISGAVGTFANIDPAV